MGEIRKTIGENIKKICKMKNIRYVDIAEHLHVSQSSISNWVKGTNSIDIENLAELCRYLEISLDQVYGFSPIVPNYVLNERELHIIETIRGLNEAGIDEVCNHIGYVASQQKYKQESSDEMVIS